LIGGESVFTPDEKVAEVLAGYEALRAKILVFEANGRLIGDAKAVVDVGLKAYFPLLHVRYRAADPGVHRFVVAVFVWSVHHGREVFATTVTGVDMPGDEKLVERLAVEE
jgi:hypothetical protein